MNLNHQHFSGTIRVACPIQTKLTNGPNVAFKRHLPKTSLNAKGDNEWSFEETLKRANKFIDNTTDFVPSVVPKSAAKTGVVIVSGIVLWWLLQTVMEVFSVFLFLGMISAVGYFVFKSQISNGSTKFSKKDNEEDPIIEAEKIMDKYR